MNDLSIHAEIARAIPVVIGGLLAAFAGIATQFLTHHLVIDREERNAKRERLERLVKSVYAHQQWVDDRFNTMIFRHEDHTTPSPLSEGRMLQALYFPELSAELAKFLQGDIPLLKFVGEQRVSRTKNLDNWLKTWNPQPYYDSYKGYRYAMDVLTAKCRKLLA